MKTKLVLLSGAALALSSCAPMLSASMNAGTSTEDVYLKTAQYFGTNPKQIEFRDIEKHTLRTTYSVVYKETFYNCHIYYGDVKCAEPGKSSL